MQVIKLISSQWFHSPLRQKGKERMERERKKKDEVCRCKEICLECWVRECMTENHRSKLGPASRLARAQKTWGEETETQTAAGDSGAWPTKTFSLTLEETNRTPPTPITFSFQESTYRCLGLSATRISGVMLSDREEFSSTECEPLKNTIPWINNIFGMKSKQLQEHKNNACNSALYKYV